MRPALSVDWNHGCADVIDAVGSEIKSDLGASPLDGHCGHSTFNSMAEAFRRESACMNKHDACEQVGWCAPDHAVGWSDDIRQFTRLQHDLYCVLEAQSREPWTAVEQHFVHVGIGDVQ